MDMEENHSHFLYILITCYKASKLNDSKSDRNSIMRMNKATLCDEIAEMSLQEGHITK
jgi:hypothetical protein